MTREPAFVLAGPDGVVVGDGVHTAFPRIADARAALASRSAPIIMGALPFDPSAPAALIRPQSVTFSDALPDWPLRELPTVRVAGMSPDAAEHRRRVAVAVERLSDPTRGLQKVVLARALQLTADAPIDARTVLHRLHGADADATEYLVDLSAAGEGYSGTAIVGASPELLVARRGRQVWCRPFAGSAPRSPDPATDEKSAAALADSAKNRHEHQVVVDALRDALQPLCTDLSVAPQPELSRTAAVWHLSTPISGTLRQSSTTALDLALALHPTPAVGGTPTDQAMALIAEMEGNRGFYAGTVGWCDQRGDGRWVVTIRGAQLSADRRSAVAHSGGGIVAESDPDDEVAETTTKFRTILTALGVADE
ncbi:isochorismate synthase [Mycolicibacterium duvalii]|uniref:isochorismate synthase n=1 Tax=Mycolicibacterium duvalii TaxID=39688 RepID=A0A7I7K3E1_9MYCO|nr:isochorismate synthase [Mycolicibacterium duvalii]MCV7367467.1 isochorismate synthase [Mycolicibacterium duvalii]PEG39219.1 isochorismate synthase [Mycolicibacterium duvalii]BBX17892.1 isochorismate synthase [Mycolicibacterium duvalii]